MSGLPAPLEKAVAAAGLASLFPILAMAAMAIKATSKGPVLFRQTRVGRHGVPFTLLKFRTMSLGSTSGPAITAHGDQRITTVGKLLRKTKIDELPELWNILRGEMSFVGPRPEVPRYVDQNDPRWREVLEARPGITDPVTLSLRNEEELLGAVQGDRDAFYREQLQPYKLRGYADYLRSRTAATDVHVIARTLVAVVCPAGSPKTLDEVIR